MNQWYLTKVKYVKQFEDGRLKRVNEMYLIDAMSFTEVEARVANEIAPAIKNDYVIDSIAKKEYSDVFLYDDSDTWHEAKLKYISVDADSGREKVVTQKFLVTAHTTKEAYDRMVESLKGMMVSYEIPSVRETKIVDVMPYSPSEQAGAKVGDIASKFID